MVGWVIGAAINLVGSIMINLGTNVMKLGHNKRAQLQVPDGERPPVTKFNEWRIGTAVFVIGNIANFVSFGYAAQSLLAALGSVQFVSNVFFASFVLKEKVTFFVIIATACIIGGCLLLVVFGNHSSDDYTVDQLLALYKSPAYVVYLVMMFVFVLGSYILYLHGKHVAMQKGQEKSFWVSILPVSYSIFSALLGTQSVLFSKSLSVLLRTTVSGESQLGNWYTWVTLICFLITAGFWVTRLNKGLRLFPAMIIVPLMQICWTLFSIVSGMIYFKEYTAFNPSTAKHGPLNAIMFVLGVMIVFLGVFLLTKGAGSSQPSEYEEMQEESAKEDQELEMVDNPAFVGDDQQQPPPGGGAAASPVAKGSPRVGKDAGPDADLPQKDSKINLDTLRFTSLASNTAILNKTGKGAKRGGPSNFSRGLQDSFARSERDPLDHQPGSAVRDSHNRRLAPITDDKEVGPHSLRDNSSMMGTLKKGAKKLQMRLRSDFNVDPEDFKQMFGMGQGGYVPALSLFAMPGVDLTSTRQRAAFNEYGTPKHNTSIAHALPSSRFYAGPRLHEDGQLQETKSEASQAHGISASASEVPAVVLEAAAAAARQNAVASATLEDRPPQQQQPATATPNTAPAPDGAGLRPPSRQPSHASLAQGLPSLPPSQFSSPYPLPPAAPTAPIPLYPSVPAPTAPGNDPFAVASQGPPWPPSNSNPGYPMQQQPSAHTPPPPLYPPVSQSPSLSHDAMRPPSPSPLTSAAGAYAPGPDMRHVQAIVRNAAARHFLGQVTPPVASSPSLTRGASPTRSTEVLLNPQHLKSHLQDMATSPSMQMAPAPMYADWPLMHGQRQMVHGGAGGVATSLVQMPSVPLAHDSPAMPRLPPQHLLSPYVPPSDSGWAPPAPRLSHPGIAGYPSSHMPRTASGLGAMHHDMLLRSPHPSAQLPTAWAAPGQASMQEMPLPGGMYSSQDPQSGGHQGSYLMARAPSAQLLQPGMSTRHSGQDSRAWGAQKQYQHQ